MLDSGKIFKVHSEVALIRQLVQAQRVEVYHAQSRRSAGGRDRLQGTAVSCCHSDKLLDDTLAQLPDQISDGRTNRVENQINHVIRGASHLIIAFDNRNAVIQRIAQVRMTQLTNSHA